jgi:hypothetical protein
MPSVTINVDGTDYTVGYDGTFDSPQGLLPALNNLNFGIFWIEQVGGVNVLTTTDDNNVFGNISTNSDPTTTTSTTTTTTTSFIPIPTSTTTSTTTTSTTLAPTTSTTTTSTTLAPTTSTTTTTTSVPTTSTTTTTSTAASTTTSTTTTTTTTFFTQTVNYASNATNACLNPTGTQNVVGNSVDFCNCTIFTSNGFVTLPNGNYVLAYSGNTLDINISGAPTITAIVTGGGCAICPLSTTTTTTSTTLQQVWYQLANCDGGGTVYTTNYDIGYALVTDRVYGNVLGVPSTLTVTSVLFSDPAGTQIGIVNSGLTGCPASTTTTTTTTTLPPVTLDLTATCTGVTQTITIDNFAGGDGTTYYANDTTYDNPALAAGGATSIIVGGTRTYTSQPNGTRYIYVYSSTRNTVKQGGNVCTTTTTTTTSTTTTTTTIAWTNLDVYYGASLGTACSSGLFTTIYYQGSLVQNVTKFYTDTTTFLPVDNGYYNYLDNGIVYVVTGSEGLYTSNTTCPTTTTTTSTTSTTTTAETTTTTSTTSTTTTATPVTYIIDTTGNGTAYGACTGSTVTSTAYAQAGYTVPIVGMFFYDNQTLTNPYVGGAGWRKMFVGFTNYAGIIDVNGELTDYVTCSSFTTTTTTTTTTLPPVTLDLTATCTGVTQTITIDNFAGGDGTTYYANDTTYDNPALAAGGATSIIVGGTRTYTSQPNGTRYIYVYSSTRNTVKQGGNVCTTTTTSTTSTTTTAAPVTYTIDNGANGSAYGACAGSVPTSTVYAASGNTVPIVSLILYTNQNLTVPFVGSVGWRKLVQGVTNYAAEVDSNGEITNYVTCSSQTTTTTTTSSTTTTTTQAPVNATISSICTGVTQTITLNNFTGGDGSTYYANTTTYGDPVSAANGPVQLVVGGTISYLSQPNGTRYVYITSTIRTLVKQGGQTCTTTTTTTSSTTTSSTTTTTTAAPVTYTVDTSGNGTPYGACTGSTVTTTVYAASGNTVPIVGLILYTNQNLTVPYVGGAGWRKLVQGGTNYAAIIDSNGEITDYVVCSSQTTTTTTSTTTTTTTLAPSYVWNTNSAAVSAQAACSASKDIYIWSYGNSWGVGFTYYAGTAEAPNQPLQPFLGGDFFYENGGIVINIDDNGVGSNYQPCPTTTTTTLTYSQYIDCNSNQYYTYGTTTGNGFSNEVSLDCVFYQGAGQAGIFFTNFLAGDCLCP